MRPRKSHRHTLGRMTRSLHETWYRMESMASRMGMDDRRLCLDGHCTGQVGTAHMQCRRRNTYRRRTAPEHCGAARLRVVTQLKYCWLSSSSSVVCFQIQGITHSP